MGEGHLVGKLVSAAWLANSISPRLHQCFAAWPVRPVYNKYKLATDKQTNGRTSPSHKSSALWQFLTAHCSSLQIVIKMTLCVWWGAGASCQMFLGGAKPHSLYSERLIASMNQIWCQLAYIVVKSSSSSHMRVINHNWSATKQRLYPQSVAEISRHSVLSGDRIQQCETSSGSHSKDTDQCL